TGSPTYRNSMNAISATTAITTMDCASRLRMKASMATFPAVASSTEYSGGRRTAARRNLEGRGRKAVKLVFGSLINAAREGRSPRELLMGYGYLLTMTSYMRGW